jgi:very-short-patch-repair endonuclease
MQIVIDYFASAIGQLGVIIESPIEQAMYESLVAQGIALGGVAVAVPSDEGLAIDDRGRLVDRGDGYVEHVDMRDGLDGPGWAWLWKDARTPPNHMVGIATQVRVDRYRADFVLTAFGVKPRTVVVECDGHDYHERTKEQAQRDRSRDRAMQRLGLQVLRFTGSEIHRDPMRCAHEAMAHIFPHLQKRVRTG